MKNKFLTLLFLSILFISRTNWAATFTIDFQYASSDDINPGDGICINSDGVCSLNAAVQEANSFPGADTIYFPNNMGIEFYGALETLKDDVTFEGESIIVGLNFGGLSHVWDIGNTLSAIHVTFKNITIMGSEQINLFHVYANNELTFQNVSLSHSNLLDNQYIVVNEGTLNFIESTVANRNLDVLSTSGYVNILKSSFTDSAYFSQYDTTVCGALKFVNTTVSIKQSTFYNLFVSGPDATYAGGGALCFVNDDGIADIAVIENSTISGNGIYDAHLYPDAVGAGIYNNGYTMYLGNNTIVNNMAIAGGAGIYNSSIGTITIKNTILSGNRKNSTSTVEVDCIGTLISEDYNLIGSDNDCVITGVTTNNMIGKDPALNPIADNGGPTLTHAPQEGSAVAEYGNPLGCTDYLGVEIEIDQRGEMRPANGTCDIGAYELQNVCGDGVVEGFEECDDGDTDSGNDCSSTCTAEDLDGDGAKHYSVFGDPVDCDDTDSTRSPYFTEICGNGIDDNCDGYIDENRVRYYTDADGDGYGTDGTYFCTDPGAGYVLLANGGDCDDNDASVGAQLTWYRDYDGDGYGKSNKTKKSCTQPLGYVLDSTDCSDIEVTVNPGMAEICGDSLNNDCSSATPDDITYIWYQDADVDGFGNPLVTTSSCGQPAGYVADATDCDDANSSVNSSEAEICADDIDNDCNTETEDGEAGVWYIDSDNDGFGNSLVSLTSCGQPDGYVAGSNDCNDIDSAINQSATETCDNIDNNCDGVVDENCTDDTPEETPIDDGSDEIIGVCGDGVIDTGEACDDGNILSEDGCSDVCATESINEDPNNNADAKSSGGCGCSMNNPSGNHFAEIFIALMAFSILPVIRVRKN